MDRFIIKSTKENCDFIGNQAIYDVIENIVNMCETVCLYGDSGVGKTYLVHAVMNNNNRNWVDMTHDLIKNVEFMDRLKSSDCHVVVDDLESDAHLVKDMFETVRSGGRLTKGSLIIISRNVGKVDFCNGVHCGHIDNPTMVTIGRRQFPKEPLARLEKLSNESRGNVRNFLYSVKFPDVRDMFRTPRDFICDLLCSDSNVNPMDYFGKTIHEHGYTWDMVHENYTDSANSNLAYISECMSQADVLDTEIYKGNWGLVPFFSSISTVAPALQIRHSLERSKIRSGSAWTKFGNFKMRHMKFVAMSNRCRHSVDIDSLMLLKQYCQTDKERALEICKEYKIVSSDMDVINHLAILNKMKPKELQSIKKSLKDATAPS